MKIRLQNMSYWALSVPIYQCQSKCLFTVLAPNRFPCEFVPKTSWDYWLIIFWRCCQRVHCLSPGSRGLDPIGPLTIHARLFKELKKSLASQVEQSLAIGWRAPSWSIVRHFFGVKSEAAIFIFPKRDRLRYLRNWTWNKKRGSLSGVSLDSPLLAIKWKII